MRQKELPQNRRSPCNIPLDVISSILFILFIPVEYLISLPGRRHRLIIKEAQTCVPWLVRASPYS